MKKAIIYTFTYCLITLIITSCVKDRICGSSFSPTPFWEKYGVFRCSANVSPFEFILRKKSQLDSLNTLSPNYFFAGPAILPLEDSGYLYITVADTLFNYTDTITTQIVKDTCNKSIYYNVSFVQRSKNAFASPGIVSVFTILAEVSPDFRVSIKKNPALSDLQSESLYCEDLQSATGLSHPILTNPHKK